MQPTMHPWYFQRCGWFNWKYQSTDKGVVDFSESKPKNEKCGWRFLMLKASKKGTSNVFTGCYFDELNIIVKVRINQIWLLCLNAISPMPVISILNSNKEVEAQVVRDFQAENNVALMVLPGKQ